MGKWKTVGFVVLTWYFTAMGLQEWNGTLNRTVLAWPNGSRSGLYKANSKAECNQKRDDYLNAYRGYYEGFPDDAIATDCANDDWTKIHEK